MARSINADLIHLAVSGIVILGLLIWGSYAVLFVQTSPSEQGSIINAVLNGENNWSSNFPSNGTMIGTSSEAQYITGFQTNIPANVASGTFLLPNGRGYAYTPLPWAPLNSTDSSYEVKYAVFTFSFCAKTGCFYSFGPYGNSWLSGPQGNISQFMDTNSYAGLESRGQADTVIIPIGTPGNYTLHYFNNLSGNVTGRVAMGWSLVDFSRSRPYLYAGLATVVVAAAFSAVTSFVSWRKHRQALEAS